MDVDVEIENKAEIINAADYGVVADGVTDVTEELQKAYAAGKLIYIKQWRYLISSPIVIS